MTLDPIRAFVERHDSVPVVGPTGVGPPLRRADEHDEHDADYFMLPSSPNGRTNVGTVNPDAEELGFAADGSLTLHLSAAAPEDETARANWLPAPNAQFALIVRAYVPGAGILDGRYRFPDVIRVV